MSENITDLEWLARRVHKWTPDDPNHKLRLHKADALNAEGWTFAHCYSCGYSFDEWQAERARLQNKPSWDNHKWPSIFQSSDGNWFGVREGWLLRDHISGGWKGMEVSLLREDGQFICHGVALMNWENSQEFRPEEQPMADKEWRGPEDGFPPPGTECEIHVRGAYEKDEWRKIVVEALTEHWVIFGEWAHPLCKSLFRPLRTEEDRAVEEWCAVIDDAISKYNINIDCCAAIKATIVESYRAGYRKQDASE